MPDLARNFEKGLRISPDKVMVNRQEHLSLHQGSREHYRMDAFFHNSEFFSQAYEFVKQSTRQAGYDSSFSKFFFLNHIFLELLLDRHIIRHTPQSVFGFYHALDEVEEGILLEYLGLHGLQNPENFIDNFNRFRKIQYLHYYTDNERLVYSLNRIIMRAGLAPLNEHNQQCTENCILVLEEWMQGAFPMLEEEIKVKMN